MERDGDAPAGTVSVTALDGEGKEREGDSPSLSRRM